MNKQELMIEYDVIDNCNLNCAACSHYAPLGENKYIPSNQADIELKKLSDIIKDECSLIHIMGGEPLMNPEIIDILKITRKHFPNTDIQLITNGILLKDMDSEFWGICHELKIKISLTLYPISLDANIIKKLSDKYNVTVIPYRSGRYFSQYVLDEKGGQNINDSYTKCNIKKCHLYKDGKLYPCSIAGCVYKLNNYFNKDFNVSNNDYINIDENITKSDIFDFLVKPIEFCKYCMVDEWNKKESQFEWRVSNNEINEWVNNN